MYLHLYYRNPPALLRWAIQAWAACVLGAIGCAALYVVLTALWSAGITG